MMRQVSHRECRYGSSSGVEIGCDVGPLADECGRVQHRLTLTPGARPLGVAVTLLGLKPPVAFGRGRTMGLFTVEAGGSSVDECECTASGMGGEGVTLDLVELVKELKQRGVGDEEKDLSGDVDTVEEKDRGGGEEDGGSNPPTETISDFSDSKSRTTDFVQGVAKTVLRHYRKHRGGSDSYATKNDDSESESPPTLVDIYLVTPNPKCRGGVQISCALSVPKCDLKKVAEAFANDVVGDEDNS